MKTRPLAVAGGPHVHTGNPDGCVLGGGIAGMGSDQDGDHDGDRRAHGLARPRRPADALDAGRHDPRFNSRRHAIRRIAVHTGIVTAVSVILIVALAAAGEGRHDTREPNAEVMLRG